MDARFAECDLNGNDYPLLQNELGTFSTTYLPRKTDDTINPSSDPINEPVNETIKASDDPIKPTDDPIKPANDPIKPADDLIKQADDPIKTDLKERIYSIIKSTPGINRMAIAEKIGKSVETVKRTLTKLKSPVLRIEYRGSKKTGGYYVIETQDKKL